MLLGPDKPVSRPWACVQCEEYVCQSFPQAVFYNRTTRAFELRSDAKRRLVRELKTAVRLGKKRNSELYRAVLSNSFSPTPLVPIVQSSSDVKRLSTIYTVQVHCHVLLVSLFMWDKQIWCKYSASGYVADLQWRLYKLINGYLSERCPGARIRRQSPSGNLGQSPQKLNV